MADRESSERDRNDRPDPNIWSRAASWLLVPLLLGLAGYAFLGGTTLSPQSHDGYNPPFGTVQYVVALVATVVLLVAIGTSLAYGAGGGSRRAFVATLIAGLALFATWIAIVAGFCPSEQCI